MSRSSRKLKLLALFCCVVTTTACADARAEPLPAPLEAIETHRVCDLLGLGGIETVPFNFPGWNAETATWHPELVAIPEHSIAPGRISDIPLIAGGDLGAPFFGGDGKTYFSFADAIFESSDNAFKDNDDLLASADANSWDSETGCIALTIPRQRADSAAAQPITWQGTVASGGRRLGRNVVPGPGFSTGRFMFMLMPERAQSCSVSKQNCKDVGGLEGDVCLVQDGASDSGLCHFGECRADPQSPCALRLITSTLAVRSSGSNFVAPTVGRHIVSPAVLEAYRGHFATVSFYSDIDFKTGNGVVWVMGRDSYWGNPELPMSPFLFFHPVSNGMLGEPVYFAGHAADQTPVLSADPSDAEPLFEETKALSQHSSLAVVSLSGERTWLLIYGGHAQSGLRENLKTFVKPLPDSIFFDRNAGIYVRWARHPWGPWSEPTTIFNPYKAGQGGFCESMFFDDTTDTSGFTCPDENKTQNANLNRAVTAGMAGEYGAAIVPGYFEHQSGTQSFKLFWILSTWNPYRVVLLSSELSLPN